MLEEGSYMCTSLSDARDIMGQNLWTPSDVMENSPVLFREDQISELEKEIGFSLEELETRAETFALVPGQTLNLVQVYNLTPEVLKHERCSREGPWFVGASFAERNQLIRDWYLISIEVVDGTIGKSYNEATRIVTNDKERGRPPLAVELAYLSMLYFARHGKVLYKTARSFTSDEPFELENGKGHLQFGFFGQLLDVRSYAEMECDPKVGMAKVIGA